MKYFWSMFALLCLGTACVKNTCPAFPEEDLKWIPYHPHQTYAFAYLDDTVTYTVQSAFASEEVSFSGENDPEFCILEAGYTARSATGFLIQERLSFDLGDPACYTKFVNLPTFKYRLEDGFLQHQISVRFVGDTTLNGIFYSGVYAIRKERPGGIHGFLKSPHTGIIAYEKGAKTYVLVP